MDVICFTIILVITIAARNNLQRVLMLFDEILLQARFPINMAFAAYIY